jgi:hypothetical protein
LLVAKKALTPLYIHDLVTEMTANERLARTVVSILRRHVQAKSVHRAVIGFHMSVTADYLRRMKLNDVHLAFILPSLIEGVTKTRNKDCVVRHNLRCNECLFIRVLILRVASKYSAARKYFSADRSFKRRGQHDTLLGCRNDGETRAQAIPAVNQQHP